MLAAGDTFRAAASEQLTIWADRVGVPIVKHQEGADAAAVVFDATASAKAKGMDILLVDTAGRLQTKSNLMEELRKMARVASRNIEGAPQETLLVLDATTGQNAVSQAKLFGDVVPLTGVVLTKLDGRPKVASSCRSSGNWASPSAGSRRRRRRRPASLRCRPVRRCPVR